MKNLIMVLFSPMSPPKNYSFSQRNFAQEYEQMRTEYQRKQERPSCSLNTREMKFDYPLSTSRN